MLWSQGWLSCFPRKPERIACPWPCADRKAGQDPDNAQDRGIQSCWERVQTRVADGIRVSSFSLSPSGLRFKFVRVCSFVQRKISQKFLPRSCFYSSPSEKQDLCGTFAGFLVTSVSAESMLSYVNLSPSQHVQLLTQIYLLTTSNPNLSSEASTTRVFLVRFRISVPQKT